MRILMYVLAAILVIAWAIGFYGTSAGNLIHMLLVIAAFAVYLGVNRDQQVAVEK